MRRSKIFQSLKNEVSGRLKRNRPKIPVRGVSEYRDTMVGGER